MASIDAPRAARASRDVGAPEVKAPEVKAPEVKASEVDAPEVDAPKADPKPAASEPAKPASAPFSAAEFWGNKNKKKAFGGGGGDGGGGSGGVSGDRRFNQDDVAGAVIVLLILLLGGWMLFNLGGASPGNHLVQPQIALNAPAPTAPRVKPDPFPPGPVDLTPKSPMPEAEPAKDAPPVGSAPKLLAQAAPSPPTPVTSPAGASCAPGRVIHAYFCTSRSQLSPAALTALDRDVAAWRACAADQELEVKGYADTRGSAEINAALGASRAKMLADILRAQGLRVVEVRGVGELDGLEDGQNCANQRRVDVGLKSEIEAASPSRACLPPKDAAPLACRSLPPPRGVVDASPARRPAR